MLNESTLKKLDALSLHFKNHAQGGAGGIRRSRTLGSSAEFSDFREYVPGDDVRRIDWNAYARFERLFLKLFMEEQEAVVHLIVDASASMKAKWAFTLQAVEMLAYMALSGGDRVRIVILSGMEARRSAVYSGRKDFMKASAFLEAITPVGETYLNEVMPRLDIRQRGMTVLFSDLFSDAGYDRALSALLYQKQELMAIHILAPEEAHPEMEGAMRLIDSETQMHVDVLAGSDALRRYQAALKQFMAELKAFCHQRSVELIPVVAHDEGLTDLLRLMMRDGMIQ